MELSGDKEVLFSGWSSLPYYVTDATTFVQNISTSDTCAQWTKQRIFIELYLGLALLANIFACYVIATTVRRRATTFVTSCIVIVNICTTAMTIHLLFFPFVFTTSLPKTQVPNKFNLQPIVEDDFGSCYQTGGTSCRISGLLLGLFIYLPLVTVTVATIERTIATFGWQMYQFRSHTVSGIMLTLFISTTFAVILSFTLPALGIGTHYVYKEFFKVCWISHTIQTSTIKGLVYLTAGIGTLLICIMLVTTFLMFRAQIAPKFRYEEGRGSHCSLLFGEFMIVKSKTWLTYSLLFITVAVVTIVIYLPLTVGYLLRYSVFADGTNHWFDVMTNVVLLIIPMVKPFLILIVHKPHRKRAAEIFRYCNAEQKSSRISPLKSPSVASSPEPSSSRFDNSIRNESFLVENYAEPLRQPTRADAIRFGTGQDAVRRSNDQFSAMDRREARSQWRDQNYRERYPVYRDAPAVHRVNPLYNYNQEYETRPKVSGRFRNHPNEHTTRPKDPYQPHPERQQQLQNDLSLTRILLRHAQNFKLSPRQPRNTRDKAHRKRYDSNLPVVRQRMSDRRNVTFSTHEDRYSDSASTELSKVKRSQSNRNSREPSYSDHTSDRPNFRDKQRVWRLDRDEFSQRSERNSGFYSVPYYPPEVTDTPTGDVPTDESGTSPPMYYGKTRPLPRDDRRKHHSTKDHGMRFPRS
ncbi:uncharacterized protein LOC100175565 [Ciona intestinalis]